MDRYNAKWGGGGGGTDVSTYDFEQDLRNSFAAQGMNGPMQDQVVAAMKADYGADCFVGVANFAGVLASYRQAVVDVGAVWQNLSAVTGGIGSDFQPSSPPIAPYSYGLNTSMTAFSADLTDWLRDCWLPTGTITCSN